MGTRVRPMPCLTLPVQLRGTQKVACLASGSYPPGALESLAGWELRIQIRDRALQQS